MGIHPDLARAVDVFHLAWVILQVTLCVAIYFWPRGRLHRLQIAMVTVTVLSQILCGGCPLQELSLRLSGAHSHGTFLASLLARWLGIPVPEVVITIMTLSALAGSLLGWSLWRPRAPKAADDLTPARQILSH